MPKYRLSHKSTDKLVETGKELSVPDFCETIAVILPQNSERLHSAPTQSNNNLVYTVCTCMYMKGRLICVCQQNPSVILEYILCMWVRGVTSRAVRDCCCHQ